MNSFLKDVNETWNKNAKAPSLEVLRALDRLRGVCTILDSVDIDKPGLTREEMAKVREAKIQAAVALMYMPDEITSEAIYIKRVLEQISKISIDAPECFSR